MSAGHWVLQLKCTTEQSLLGVARACYERAGFELLKEPSECMS